MLFNSELLVVFIMVDVVVEEAVLMPHTHTHIHNMLTIVTIFFMTGGWSSLFQFSFTAAKTFMG